MKNSFHKLMNLVVALSLLLMSFLNLDIQTTQAQTPIDTLGWQNDATGMNTTSNKFEKTAGLGFTVDGKSWPSLRMHGGVSSQWDLLFGPSGIELGSIKTPQSSSASLISQDSSWAKNKMTFTPSSGAAVDLWVSRLTPALLANTTGSTLRLFTGNVPQYRIINNTYSESTGPVKPKYIAYGSGSAITYAQLSSSITSLSSLDKGWLMLWFGNNSHFSETKRILDYGAPPLSDGFLADIPILLIFQNQPVSIKASIEGGVELTYGGSVGKMVILPLYGRNHLEALQTENWYNNLPASVMAQINFWVPRMGYFPADVSETYSFTNGQAIITETIRYETVRTSGSIKFAPLSPILALAEPLLSPTFSAPLTDGNLPTQFGPIKGFNNVDSYSWWINNLIDTVDQERIVPSNVESVPDDVMGELEDQVQSLIDAGHMDPWLYADQIPNIDYRGDLYWANPADTLYHLAEVADALPDGEIRNELINYMVTERNTYPPEDVYNLDFGQGVSRGTIGLPVIGDVMETVLTSWRWSRPDVFLTNVPLYSFYGLSRYYQVVGSAPSNATFQKAVQALDRDMKEQDWATLGYFNGFQESRVAVVSSNRHFAGMIGFIRLARRMNDTNMEQLGLALFAKAAVARLGQLHYPRYLAEAGLIELPASPQWQVKGLVDSWEGLIFNYSWTSAYDDPRQPLFIDQFDITLFDHSGPFADGEEWDQGTTSPYLICYRDMVPELALLFANSAPDEARITMQKVQDITPHWYATYNEATFGMEHNMTHPVDSFQLFLADTYLDQPDGDQMARYADISWLERGDLFYMQKLAETVLKYRGAVWQNSIKLYATSLDKAIQLNWKLSGWVDTSFTWRVDYRLHGTDTFQSISGLDSTTRSYTLANLINYKPYDLRVAIESAGVELFISNTVVAFPTNLHQFFPSIRR